MSMVFRHFYFSRTCCWILSSVIMPNGCIILLKKIPIPPIPPLSPQAFEYTHPLLLSSFIRNLFSVNWAVNESRRKIWELNYRTSKLNVASSLHISIWAHIDSPCRSENANLCDFRDLLDEAKDYHLMPERRQTLKSFRTRPRCCTEIVEFIVAVGGLTSSGLWKFKLFLLLIGNEFKKQSRCMMVEGKPKS